MQLICDVSVSDICFMVDAEKLPSYKSTSELTPGSVAGLLFE